MYNVGKALKAKDNFLNEASLAQLAGDDRKALLLRYEAEACLYNAGVAEMKHRPSWHAVNDGVSMCAECGREIILKRDLEEVCPADTRSSFAKRARKLFALSLHYGKMLLVFAFYIFLGYPIGKVVLHETGWITLIFFTYLLLECTQLRDKINSLCKDVEWHRQREAAMARRKRKEGE